MPSIEESELYEELEVSLKAAKRAGEIMNKFREDDVQVSQRKHGVNDIVTEADLRCQEKIVEVIEKEFPKDDFKGEEQHLTPDEDSERVWVIDPIDGTTNFHSGWTYFCTSIALRVNSNYEIGVIHSPSSGLGKTWIGIEDQGAYILEDGIDLENRKSIEVSNREKIETGFFTCFQSPDNNERRVIEQELITELTSRDMNYREFGSGALTLPEIAEGGLDARFDFVNEWDYAAASLILEEAGGNFEKIGERFGKDAVISTNGKLHKKFKEAVQNALAQH